MVQLCENLVLLLGIYLLQVSILQVGGENFYTQLERLNPQQRREFNEFKQAVLPILPQEWMKDDTFLIKYAEFNRFNVQKSINHLKDTLKWRQDNKVDEIVDNPPEFFKEMEKDYPIYNDGFDKEGRPICEYAFGAWPVRKAAITGKIQHLSLYMLVNCMERASIRLREQQAAGVNVTQFVMITNLEGFNLLEHACPACIPFALAMTAGTEKYYPAYAHGFWLINTPDTFATLFRLLKPILSPPTRNAIEFFTPNEAEWKPYLQKRVDFSQISDWYGGAKERKA